MVNRTIFVSIGLHRKTAKIKIINFPNHRIYFFYERKTEIQSP